MPKKSYTVKDIAGLLGFSTNTVYKYLDEGKIKATRLGSEGRFRIPETEVERLLQEVKGGTAEMQVSHSSALRPRGAPSLFDWFIGFLSMGLGFSQFLFPTYLLGLSFSTHLPYLTIFHILLFIFGGLLVSLEILKLENQLWHDSVHVFLGILFIILGIIFVTSGAVPTAVGYLAAAAIILLTAIWKLDEYYRFLVYVGFLYLFLGVGVLIWPSSFSLAMIIIPASANLGIFVGIWFIGLILLILTSVMVARKGGVYIRIQAFAICGVSLLYAAFAFTSGLWGRAVYCVILGSFALIFPFSSQFESFTLKSRKELIGSFLWLLGLFFTGSIVLYLIYHSFQGYIQLELRNRVNTASDIVSTLMIGNVAKVSAFAQSADFINLMKNQGKINSVAADESLKQLYLTSNNTLRRAVLVDKNGIIVDTYPYNLSSQGVDVSSRDYFLTAKRNPGTSITGILQPSSPGILPAVLVTSPIIDASGNFLGILSGSVDLDELAGKVNLIKFGENGRIFLADATGKYILAPDADRVLTKVPEGSALSKAVDGENGVLGSYGSDGNLSITAYTKIPDFGWAIAAEQPTGEVLRAYSITGFVIFLVLIMSGVGSLLLAIHSRGSRNLY